jgi:predicted transcriptional regulator
VARIREDAVMSQAAETLALAGSCDLMVIDDQGQFVGVLPEGDILRAGLPDIQEIIGAGGSLDAAFERFVIKARDMSSLPISHLVIRNALALDPDDHVARAAIVFVDMGIRVLPVVREGHLLGSVSRADICAALVGEWSRLSLHVD